MKTKITLLILLFGLNANAQKELLVLLKPSYIQGEQNIAITVEAMPVTYSVDFFETEAINSVNTAFLQKYLTSSFAGTANVVQKGKSDVEFNLKYYRLKKETQRTEKDDVVYGSKIENGATVITKQTSIVAKNTITYSTDYVLTVTKNSQTVLKHKGGVSALSASEIERQIAGRIKTFLPALEKIKINTKDVVKVIEYDDAIALKKLIDAGQDIRYKIENGSLFLRALSNGKQNIVDFLLEQGIDINIVDDKGQSLLHKVAQKGNLKAYNALKKRGLDEELKDKQGVSPKQLLHNYCKADPVLACSMALKNNDNITVLYLIDNGYLTKSNMPLVEAVQLANIAMVGKMLEAGADPLKKEKTSVPGMLYAIKIPPMYFAYKNNDKAMIQLLQKYGGSLNFQFESRNVLGNTFDDTPLSEAVRTKDTAKVDMLLKFGAKINYQGDGITALDFCHDEEFKSYLRSKGAIGFQEFRSAVKNKDYEFVIGALLTGYCLKNHFYPELKSILEEKSKTHPELLEVIKIAEDAVNIKDLEKAITENDITKVKKIMESDPDFSSLKYKPLQLALSNNRKEIVGLLLEYGEDPNQRGKFDSKPVLQYAWTTELIDLLLKAGADINAKDSCGNTVLANRITSLYKTNYEIAKHLIKAGADINVNCKYRDAGEGPLLTVITNKKLDEKHSDTNNYLSKNDYVKLLLEAGAKIPKLYNTVNTGYGSFKRNFLVSAIQNLSDNVCIELIKKGADPFLKVGKGYSGYEFAKKMKRKELVKYMKSLK